MWDAEIFFSPRALSLLRSFPQRAALEPCDLPEGREAFAVFGDLSAWPPQESDETADDDHAAPDLDASDPLEDWPDQ
jgi:hypothetical protein